MAVHTARLTAADRDRRQLHQLLAEAFDDAAELVGRTESTVRIGSEIIRIRTAGDALAAPLTRALAHLRDPSETLVPTATIDAWDSASTGRQMPLLVDHLLDLLDRTWLEHRDVRGEIIAFYDGPVRAAYYGDQLLSVYDTERRAGIYWLRDAAALPWYEAGAPFRVLIDWITAGPTRQLLHAGAIAGPDGGVLLGGAGGSGKSTTALACLGDPSLQYVSDDYVVVDLRDEPVAASVYSTAKLKALSDLDHFEGLRPSVVNLDRVAGSPPGDPAAQKPMLFVHEHAPERVTRETPVNALVFPLYLALEDCTVEPLPADVAFRYLAPSTIQQGPAAGASALRCMRTLTQRVPSFRLGLPTDPRRIPDAVARILAEVS